MLPLLPREHVSRETREHREYRQPDDDVDVAWPLFVICHFPTLPPAKPHRQTPARGLPFGHAKADGKNPNGPTTDEQSLPCLDILEATPEILRRLMAGVTDADARWKPAPERFSIAEVLAHLSHSEGHCYRMRLERFLSEQRPEFEPDDAQLYLDLYRDADPEDAFEHFEEQRETNIEFIRGLPGSDGSRVALHKEAGEITLAQMLHEWAMHDLGHIRQIAELVRARKYLEGAGPLGASYNLKP